MVDSVAAMHCTGHKKVKYMCLSRNAILAGHVNAKERIWENVRDYPDAISHSGLLQNDAEYGNVTEDYKALHAKSVDVINCLSAIQTSFSVPCSGSQVSKVTLADPAPKCQQVKDVTDLKKLKEPESKTGNGTTSVIIVDSDDEDGSGHVENMQPSKLDRLRDYRAWLSSQRELRLGKDRSCVGAATSLQFSQGIAMQAKRFPSIQYEKVVLKDAPEKQGNRSVKRARGKRECTTEVNVEKATVVSSSQMSSQDDNYYTKPSLTSNHDDTQTSKTDGLEDLWKDMSIAMECSKGTRIVDESSVVRQEKEEEEKEEEEDADEDGEGCAHSFVLQDDLGLVCRVCGVIQRRIETIFDYQWGKGARTTRTCMCGSRNSRFGDIVDTSGDDIMDYSLIAADVSIHPRHMKQMKPHQIEGFNFLVKNLLGNPPGGCILAHAPGSGKTFMLISFIQSFMAKDAHARPLVVLPKGILATWRKEFQRWKVEDIPLYDLYSSGADIRLQQLEVLNKWQENRSILLLGYKQFANIICEAGSNKATAACQDKLLKVPTLLILDEGHTPRNDNTDMVDSLAKVRTPCKVVLSGTLFQNHVGEVFNILKLVRPNFMKTESSRAIVKRILSRVHISGGRKPSKGNQESYFCDLVEDTLRNDGNYKRKIAVIQELRNMTCDVLHYYKGDFSDELPGLVDFTVLLNLGAKQKQVIKKLGKLDKFKKSSLEKAIYMHPRLLELRDNASGDKDTSIDCQKIDSMIESLNIREGVKAKFFLSLLSMAESSGEKVLVFSQYLIPLKFLEMLIIQVKGWRTGKEIFVISGDSAPDDRERSMDQFNSSSDAKVFFGSIKACGEGISLVGASRVVILDVHLNPSVTRQAIGRAFRPGQERKVYVYRLVAADSQEEEDHITSFRKETVSKMWFEWSEHCGHQDFKLDAIDIGESQDAFFENPALREDVKALYMR